MQKLYITFKATTLITLSLFVLIGLYMTIWEIKPFWLDEWFIIYNIKFKSTAELWGTLDFMQQFPRVYLHIIHWYNAIFNYSYTSLHFTSFLVHAVALVFCYWLSALLYKEGILQRFLWVMIYAAFRTGIEYFIQVKQYTMEMFLGLVALWQLIMLLKAGQEKLPTGHYLLLCASLLLSPFFSYTYPIAISPVFIIILLQNSQHAATFKNRIYQWLPLLLSIAGILCMYIIDTRQVMQDKGMQNYWSEYMMTNSFSISMFFSNTYKLFANAGSGGLFEVICAILGIFSWLYITVKPHIYTKQAHNYPALYSALLIWIIVLLFAAGKLPIGMHRLNAFATPALGILIIHTLSKAMDIHRLHKVGITISVVLFLAMAGNIYSSFINDFTNDSYIKKLRIYRNVTEGIAVAHKQNLPVIVSTAIAYPYEGQVKGDWILKTYPEYNANSNIGVYAVDNINDAVQVLNDSTGMQAAVAIDADSTYIIHL